MARNSEKAMTTLARWRAAHIDNKKDKEIRPYLATECDNLHKAEKFRRQIIGEVSKKVAQIQNAGLGEFKLRDLNDEINKLIREKRHWEDRIKDLGGPDYKRIGPKMLDREGKEIPGNRGYRYFGATRDLPGVRELFEKAPPPPPKKTRGEFMQNVDADYYGYRDEDDCIIFEQEAQKEAEVEISIFARKQPSKVEPGMETCHENHLKSYHVPVPSQKEIEQALVIRKKREILEKYASEALQVSEEETKKLLGIL
ncbi:hypothetical protein HELRODRAFT_190435 [Helobdella robusta]|uniref:Pre-mRNA-splicing factor ISY1 homolog n=1 Tax=Helobdella robusta TaxID=6412 RepID=T1FRZ6_HELRO|nr:hypothetical protein HELRODRAFT_190435 [Helobdella robusta]ESO09226.1 hypothetical protein HELRODRAFT_190435 [Helobdella robusta]